MARIKEVVVEKTFEEKLLGSGESLKQAIGDTLGMYLSFYIRKDVNKHGEARYFVESGDLTDIGIAKLFIETLTFGSFGHIYIPEKNGDAKDKRPRFDLHASYKHPGGGSNGHSVYVGKDRVMLYFDEKDERWICRVINI